MKQDVMQSWWQSSYLFEGSAPYIEDLYEQFLADPSSVTSEWRQCFEHLPKKNGHVDVSHAAIRDYFKVLARSNEMPATESAASTETAIEWQAKELLQCFRRYGHFQANTDPLGLAEKFPAPMLKPEYHGLSNADLNKKVSVQGYSSTPISIADMVSQLQNIYCDSIGYQFTYISNPEEVQWLQQRIEQGKQSLGLNADQKRQILQLLVATDGLEKYLGAKYVGQTRFSLEGGDSFIPQLCDLLQRASDHGVDEAVIGMAHRGRLNVLINVLGKSPQELFSAFEGKYQDAEIAGDVKYHLGYSSDIVTKSGSIHVPLAFNPSHLEIINPVIAGSVRARQELRTKAAKPKNKVLSILIHGDAAFAGQGVVMETLNMSQTPGFTTGGSIHIIINNQIGFTISNPQDARSSFYCSDLAKMVESPVFHVNADDVEAVIFATKLALDYRMTFNKDVFIDLVCYRRYGHNEADEPTATQPVMYKVIRSHATPREIYAEKLIAENVVTAEEVKKMVDDYRSQLDAGLPVVKTIQNHTEFSIDWGTYKNQKWDQAVNTGVDINTLMALGKKLAQLPAGFTLQAQVKKEIDNRSEMIAGNMPLNWGAAETLAYATLVTSGYPVRLCGQDCGRGTFSHRHAVLHENMSDKLYVPLANLDPKQATIKLVDSLLSEEAVMGFEYGYAASAPNTLVLWEAQYGDFCNGAQVIIDQFISSSETKWGRLNGLVLLLPHAYEGAGPEHSSARLERFLQLCAENNMQVCVPSTPAQMFHLLRRQMVRPYRKPLIVLTPKSLLRHKLAVSSLDDLVDGEFHNVIAEVDKQDVKAIRRVIFCSGKVYYDLLAQRRAQNQNDIAIVRVEQLYPFPENLMQAELTRYAHVKDIVWCQEEPKNQGAWWFMQPHILEILLKGQKLSYVGRDKSASPAVGSSQMHKKQQDALVASALK